MRSFQDFKTQAIDSLRVAEYMLTNTYPAVKEPKLLLAILDDIYVSLVDMQKAFLVRENLSPDDDFMHLFSEFKALGKKYGFVDDDFDLIFKVHRIIEEHRSSSVEFSRKDKFIICLDSYRMEPLGVEDINGYLFKAKGLLKRLESAK